MGLKKCKTLVTLMVLGKLVIFLGTVYGIIFKKQVKKERREGRLFVHTILKLSMKGGQ